MARFRLIPREEKFYADFIALADQLVTAAGLLERMMASDPPDWSLADQIQQVEHDCDTITHEIIQRLNRTFVTPIDREDIHSLAKSLDDVMTSCPELSESTPKPARLRLWDRRWAISGSSSTIRMRPAEVEGDIGGVSIDALCPRTRTLPCEKRR